MIAIQFLRSLRDTHCLPHTKEGTRVGPPSNGELRRWLEKGSVLINGTKPRPGDTVSYPIDELVFFPGGKSQVTIIA